MKLQQEFLLARPLEQDCAFFDGVPAVACLPDAGYPVPSGEGRHTGKASKKVGPLKASFEVETDIACGSASRKVSMSGMQVVQKGAARGKVAMCCALAEAGDHTRETDDADYVALRPHRPVRARRHHSGTRRDCNCGTLFRNRSARRPSCSWPS